MEFDPNRVYNDWRDEFHKNGCVVIKNVISPERAQYYCDKQIAWLKKFELGFDEKNPDTWTAEHLPVSFKGSMYYAYGSTHEKFAWEARTEPAVIEIFEKALGDQGTHQLVRWLQHLAAQPEGYFLVTMAALRPESRA